MPSPTLVADYAGEFLSPATITPSFSPAAGELIVVKATTFFLFGPFSTPTDSDSALTFTRWVNYDPRNTLAAVWTAPVVTAPGPITISLQHASAGDAMFCSVERWSGAQLAASPIISTQNGNSAPPNPWTITTAKAGSVVSWTVTNDNGGTASAYVTTSTTPVIECNSVGVVHAEQAAPVAGVQHFGIAATSQTSYLWTAVALEIQAAPPMAQGNFFSLMLRRPDRPRSPGRHGSSPPDLRQGQIARYQGSSLVSAFTISSPALPCGSLLPCLRAAIPARWSSTARETRHAKVPRARRRTAGGPTEVRIRVNTDKTVSEACQKDDRPWEASAPCPCWYGRCLVDLARGPGACMSLATWRCVWAYRDVNVTHSTRWCGRGGNRPDTANDLNCEGY